MKKLKVVLIGAGSRGGAYTDRMLGDKYQIVGVAEPKENRRNYIKEKHGVSDEYCFDTWERVFEVPKFADIAIISTLDQLHHGPALKAIEMGYDLLLEKPASNDCRECIEIANAAKEKGTKILVCHVLRYSPFFMRVKQMVDDGMIGKVMSIHHSECVGNVHQSHSFVRGNWGNTGRSSCMILQKSCHDMDIMQWLMGVPCKRVQSFGTLTYFTKENAPEGAPEYCDKTCPVYEECYYNAIKRYVEDETNAWFREAASNMKNPTNEQVIEALRKTQYGKCVFKCDNDVVDKQVVNLEFENGAVASFNMCAFNKGGRYMRLMGTDGEIYADMEKDTIEYYSFKTKERVMVEVAPNDSKEGTSGHGGGDVGIVESLYDYVANDIVTTQLSTIDISVKNHIIAFAAEKSRLEGKVIDIKEFEKEMGLK